MTQREIQRQTCTKLKEEKKSGRGKVGGRLFIPGGVCFLSIVALNGRQKVHDGKIIIMSMQSCGVRE